MKLFVLLVSMCLGFVDMWGDLVMLLCIVIMVVLVMVSMFVL